MSSILSLFRAGVGLVADVAGELVGPSGCAACDASVRPRVLFCPACAASIERTPATAGDRVAVAAFEYGGAIATAIARLKYQERPDLGPRLGVAMVHVASSAMSLLRGNVDVVVPVPLHPKRLAERGYNQAALLAAPVARALGAPLAASALRRLHDTPRQAASASREERRVNVEAAFRARGGSVDGPRARVLLVDDVRTTGATLDACAVALRQAGARTTHTLVLARRT